MTTPFWQLVGGEEAARRRFTVAAELGAGSNGGRDSFNSPPEELWRALLSGGGWSG
jgi:hypothetical protein